MSGVRYQASPPYLLYVGNAYPHKNLEQLIRVMPMIRERHSQLQLVLVGREDEFYRKLRLVIGGLRSAGERTSIVFTGPVPEDELRALIAGAVAYVSPSMDEGFDLPTVEALAAGTPVVASDIPIHREVLGDAFATFVPDDDVSLTDVIHRLLIHSDAHATLVERGIARAQRYSWRTCAMRTLDAYRSCLDAEPQRQRDARVADPPATSPPHSSSRISTRG